ncbi:AMP-binding protein [Bradyrhizobium elkanii]|uniref:Fatty-acyl-CoA synthase n=1 Tax=Bradyrhizobium elkanii TaxID=29448 RepID=A0ABV4F5V1_BRAEL|nr:AMP-binding protein [Bradyrhizobium elkanii]MCP1750399.1 fatty-acyl-CoA synthase [Bradyrhizobium elkanii]MCP1976175.1 fatty-acyl-CoA synthase [Bradyrhizobium elkanii]MCS3889309.1 fatty-acyl-CoA synthase [Bradyrhizobium elkanii]MCS4211670.1 fatty-acyl-CoA synthase [Bradyrhizobium elkanii]MCW2192700.1 fatty-acyl-CoA synthase [Bradyrhizobium elkanii]
MINLSSFIAFHARRTPDRCALKYRGEDVSYADFDLRIRQVGGWLAARGIAPGDVVAVLMKNSTAFLELVFATSHIGAVFLPINYRLSADEVAYIVGNSGARLLVADEEFAAIATGGAPVVLLDEVAQSSVTNLAPDIAPAPIHVRGPRDLMRLMYTSGTTDRPKGVMLSYENIYWKSADQTLVLGLNADTRLLVVGPLYHVGALDLPGIAVLWHGGMLCIHRTFEPEPALAAIEREKLNAAWFAPVMTTALLTCPNRERYDVSSLQWAIGGGEKTPELRIRAFSDYFGNARYIDAYGLTESCGGDTFMDAGREIEKIGSTGRAIAHVEIEIRDDAGKRLPAGQNGEICLRGPKVTQGYWKDPEKTASAFFGDWFRTGDVGYLDNDGFLYLTDRKKDMIISGGENIASSEVERVIYEMPEVREVAVIGLPDARWGEKPVAIVVLADDAKLDLPGLTDHCRTRLAGFKVPRQLVIRDSLPRNPSGKVLKRVLRAELEATA